MKTWFKYFLVVSFVVGFCVEGYGQAVTWQKVYGSDTVFEMGRDGIQTSDGGYMILVLNYQTGMNLLKLDKFGEIEWTKAYNRLETGNSIKQTSDGGYIISGLSFDTVTLSNRGLLLRIDSFGNRIWEKYYVASYLRKVVILKSGEFLACGRYDTQDSIYAYVLKTDTSGSLLWQYTLDVGSNAYDIIESDDRKFYYFTGNVGFGQNARTLIGKITSNNNLVWYKSHGNNQGGISILQDSFDKIVITGGYGSIFSYFAKFDTSGNYILQNTIPKCSQLTGMSKTTNGDYVITGGYVSYVVFAKINRDGLLLDSIYFSTGKDIFDYSYAISNSFDGGFLITGLTNYPTGNDLYSNVYVIKTDSSGYAEPLSINQISTEVPSSFKLYQNYPNPFNSQTKIIFEIKKAVLTKIKIYNILGQEIITLIESNLDVGTYEVDFNSNELDSEISSGILFYKIITSDYSETKKMILLR